MINAQKKCRSGLKLSRKHPVVMSIFAGLVYAFLPLAHAEDTNYSTYINSAVGMVSGSTSASRLSNDLAENGISVTAMNIDDSRNGWKLNLGVELTEQIALEVGYLDLGTVDITLTAEVADSGLFSNQVENIHPSSADGFTLSGVYRYYFNSNFTLFGLVGLFAWRGEFDTYTTESGERMGSDNTGRTDLYYGVGGGYNITDKLTLVFEGEYFKLDNENSQMWSIGARHQF